MVRLISRQRGDLAALKLTKLFGIDYFPAAKDSGEVLIIIIYCYLIIIRDRDEDACKRRIHTLVSMYHSYKGVCRKTGNGTLKKPAFLDEVNE